MSRARGPRALLAAALVAALLALGGCGDDEEPAPAAGRGWWYTGLWGSGAGEVVVAGFDFDAAEPFVQRRDPAGAWTTTPLDVSDLVAAYRDHYGQELDPAFVLWPLGGTAAELHLAGDFGTVYRRGGGAWQRVASDFDLTDWRGVWGDGTDVVIVGTGGKILHGKGGAYTLREPTGADLFDVWGAAADQVWAVGAAVLYWNGTTWQTIGVGPGAAWFAVDGRAFDDVWVGGEVGLLLHYDGMSWQVDHQHPGGDIADLACLPGGAVVALATDADGTEVLLREAAWQVVHTLPAVTLDAVWGSAVDDIWADGSAGKEGVLVHWDGAAWTRVSVPRGAKDARGPVAP